MTDERKQRQLQQLGKRESAFLRLRRTKLGLDDFRTVKVIGKGAFGEVRRGRPVVVLAINDDLTHGCFKGQSRTEDGHGEDLRYEDAEEGRDVEEGSGACGGVAR